MDVRLFLVFLLTLVAGRFRDTYGTPTITHGWKNGQFYLCCKPNSPSSKIRWLRNGVAIGSGNKVIYVPPSYQDNGTAYTCAEIATTKTYEGDEFIEHVSMSSRIFDDRKATAGRPIITTSPKKDIKVGDTVKLTCTTVKPTRNNDWVILSWYRNNSSIEHDISVAVTADDDLYSAETLTVNTTKEDNGAEYLCLATEYYYYYNRRTLGNKRIDKIRNIYPVSIKLEVQPRASQGTPGPTTATTSGSTATDGAVTGESSNAATKRSLVSTEGGITPQSSNSGDVIQAVTLTFIFVLVVAVVVLGFFFIRMKRRVRGKQPESAKQMNEIDPSSSAKPPDDFNEYAHIGRVHQPNDEYRSFDYGRSVHGHANAAFERDSADYTEYEADGTPLDRDPQGRLEDGYEGKGSGETPEYMVLGQEATNPSSYENTGQQGEEPGYSLEGAVASPLGGAGDVDDYEYSTPENVQNGYSLVDVPKPTSEDADDYSQPYSHPQTAGSKMAAGNKMAARGWHGNAPSGDDDDYNRLDHPNLKKPW